MQALRWASIGKCDRPSDGSSALASLLHPAEREPQLYRFAAYATARKFGFSIGTDALNYEMLWAKHRHRSWPLNDSYGIQIL